MAKLALVSTAGLGWVLDRLTERVTHLAIGDGAAPISGGETALGNELFRKPVGPVVIVDQEVFWDTNVGTVEANFPWKEAALFADGAATPGSGTLIARFLVTYDHTTTKEATTVSTKLLASRP